MTPELRQALAADIRHQVHVVQRHLSRAGKEEAGERLEALLREAAFAYAEERGEDPVLYSGGHDDKPDDEPPGGGD